MAAAEREGIEQAHFDIGMRIDRREAGILALEREIVEQQPHAHAAIGGLEQGAQQTPTAAVAFPEVVLRVDRLLRHRGEGIAALEGVTPGSDELDTRKA